MKGDVGGKGGGGGTGEGGEEGAWCERPRGEVNEGSEE